jgi:hypothetical protein
MHAGLAFGGELGDGDLRIPHRTVFGTDISDEGPSRPKTVCCTCVPNLYPTRPPAKPQRNGCTPPPILPTHTHQLNSQFKYGRKEQDKNITVVVWYDGVKV